ncbi:hypothetical protein V6667_01205 [Neisseria leonii]
MSVSFSQAVDSGRRAYLSAPVAACAQARASTPTVGQPFWHSSGYTE